MNLLMISGDRSILAGRKGAFHATLQELIKHWDRIDVICPRPAGEVSGRLSAVSIPDLSIDGVFFHPSPHGLWYQPWWIVNKGRELHAKHGIHVMTVHEYPPFYNGIGASMLAQQLVVPYVVEIHHIVGYPKSGSVAEWLGKWMSRLYLGIDVGPAAKVRTVNEEVKRVLVGWGIPEAKIETAPSFYLDKELLTGESGPKFLEPSNSGPSSIGGDRKKYDVCFCARLVANKGLLEVVRAIGSLPGVSLLVIGDGPEKYPAKRVVRELGIENRVTFVGWLPGAEDVVGAIRSARVFVMNSKSEGGPRVALEAMACGMPVIATRVGVMPDVIRDGENGVFSTGTHVDLASKIQSVLADEALRERLGKAARRVMERFEKSVLVERYAGMLKEVARR